MVVGLSGWGRDGGKCGGGQEGEEAAAGEAVLRICIPPLSTPFFLYKSFSREETKETDINSNLVKFYCAA